MSNWQTGIDVGGTNTDLLTIEPDLGEFRIAKVPSDAADQSQGVMRSLEAAGVPLTELVSIIHGTTIATNAVLERRGARCGLITTRGFRDVLELGRRTRPRNYGMFGRFEAIIDREFRLEVDERLDARGRVLVPLDEAGTMAAMRQLLDLGAEALVIQFLHSYANPVHEEQALAIARQIWPNAYVTASSHILREVREFERASTAAINAFVQPVVARYLGRLSESLDRSGFAHGLLVMQGNGGTMAAEQARHQPVQTVMSGPAAGAIAAAEIGVQAGFPNLIACDMGGTSFDVSLIRSGTPAVTAEKDIDYAVPIRVPMVDIHTIGAGGGSIAYVDAGGILRVGPQSAGASPGPVCYGRGGERPTVTDANVLLGRIDAAGMPGVDSAASLEATATALEKHVAGPLGIGTLEAAAAILEVAGNQLASAIRLVSIEKGHDPRDFALFPFGGAGPLHAVALARELGIPRVLVPRFPGLTSALGCVLADLRHDFVDTVWRPLADVPPSQAEAILTRQAEAGRHQIVEQRTPIDRLDVVHEADLLYRGQSHVFRVRIEGETFDPSAIVASLEARYHERFNIRLEGMVPVLASLRTTVLGRRRTVDLSLFGPPSGDRAPEPAKRRRVHFAGAFVDTPIHRRDALGVGSVIEGPAIVEQSDSTIVVDPGAVAVTDRFGNIVIDVAPNAH